jgi:hypothetical protein
VEIDLRPVALKEFILANRDTLIAEVATAGLRTPVQHPPKAGGMGGDAIHREGTDHRPRQR